MSPKPAHFSSDMEKNPSSLDTGDVYDHPHLSQQESNAVPGENFDVGDSFYAKAQRLAGRFHIEQRGIERVPDDERHDNSMLNVATLWLSANMVVSSLALGVLGRTIWYLGFADSILVIIFFNLLGVLPVCFFSSFGPVFGLRQMVLSRFWFGWWGAKVVACCNIISCIGWSSVNSIVGAQLIHAVNNDVPGWVGILIIAFCTFFVTLFGYKVVHMYEFWSWIPAFIIFMIILGQFAHSGAFVDISWSTGDAELGGVLSFGATILGYSIGWASYAADYTVYQPCTQSKKSVFFWTWLGLIVPLLFTQMLGAALITAVGDMDDLTNPYWAGYNQSGSGGLIGAILIPPFGRFGEFCIIMLALSVIAANCTNSYSVSLTVQTLGSLTQRIPRFLWTLAATGVYIAIGISGYYRFQEVLETFLDLIAYWATIYSTIGLLEHFVFKRGFSGYQPQFYDQPNKLPPGISAVFAFCSGIAGMVLGMSQTWWVGPIALYAGESPYGGDVGFELAAAFSGFAYLCTRPFEKRYFK